MALRRLRAAAAEAALAWIEATHGNEFGHDHHCPVRTPVGEEWREPVTERQLENCTCGWSAFRRQYDRMIAG